MWPNSEKQIASGVQIPASGCIAKAALGAEDTVPAAIKNENQRAEGTRHMDGSISLGGPPTPCPEE